METRAQKQDLLVDNLDAQGTGRAGDGFDDGLEGGVPRGEALVLGLHLPLRHIISFCVYIIEDVAGTFILYLNKPNR